MHFFLHYLLVAGLFAVIDAVWISVIANKFYKKQLGGLLKDKPNFVPAVLFYIISVFGIVIFAVNPALGRGSFNYALEHGALLGLVTYATYDLTNDSTLKKWPRAITIVDMIWGTLVTTAVSIIAFAILK
jgi:uncharacterized membrane protein